MQESATDIRGQQESIESIDDLLKEISEYHSSADLELVRKAYEFSQNAHEGQFRRSGEPYISHPLSVAGILAKLKMDMSTVITGLLHDTVEDTGVTLEQIESVFGEDIKNLVDGVTKISQISFRHTHEKQGENIRKMIVAMGRDIRVILVKLADRLHNMRTLNHMPYEKQARIAQETLDIYAPLANRLGISEWKVELEDLSLRYLKPDIYYSLVQKVSKKKKEREKYIDEVKRLLTSHMEKSGIKCEIQGRPKHLYSIYKKMAARNIEFEQVFDILAFRIIVDNLVQCYEALGVVHSMYKPIPGRFKDFIAMAKANNYQSLHTTVFGPRGERIEIQIRTNEMHLIAERGIAAHWKYKESGKIDPETEKKFYWLRDLVRWHQQLKDPDEFLEGVKTDLADTEIYVFTPKGEVRAFPDGATPLDFAYAIHTDVGHHTVGAKVNGRIVQLKYQLQSGDTVEILTSPNQKPSKDWLKYSVTLRAQSKIRSFVRNEERKRAIEIGEGLLEKELRRLGLGPTKYFKQMEENSEFLQKFGANDLKELFSQVGYGKFSAGKVIEELDPEAKSTKVANEDGGLFGRFFKKAISKRRRSDTLIKVDGLSDMLVRYAKCCNPIPGDPIVGFISRGRGVTIHQAACRKVYESDEKRRIDVAWEKTEEQSLSRQTKIKVVVQDAPGLLRQMSECFTTRGINILNAQIRTTKDHKATCIFDVAVSGTSQVSMVIQDLQKLRGIIKVERLVSQ